MTKSAFLPAIGDPFVLLFWFRFFKNVWQNEVDRLYISINSPVEKKVLDFQAKYVSQHPKVKVTTTNQHKDHGPTLTEMLLQSNEELVMFIEDDGIIFKPNAVVDAFDKIEKGHTDIVVGGRGSAATSLIEAAKTKYNLDYSGYGDKGPHFWPNFFFAKREDLLKTDLNFAGKSWKKGDYIKELDLTIPEDIASGDTFVWGSIQLRAMGLRIQYLPQYHASPNDLEQYERKEWLWDGNCPWFHLGSISSGIFGLLTDDNYKALAFRNDPNIPSASKLPLELTTEGEKLEIERRVMWWSLCYEETKNECQEIEDFGKDYAKAIERIINDFGLDRTRIEKRKTIYKELLYAKT